MRLVIRPAVAAGMVSAALLAPSMGRARPAKIPVAHAPLAHLDIGEANGQFVIRPIPAASPTSPDLLPIGASIRIDARLIEAQARRYGELAR